MLSLSFCLFNKLLAYIYAWSCNDTHSFEYKWYIESIETGRQQVYVHADGHLSLHG